MAKQIQNSILSISDLFRPATETEERPKSNTNSIKSSNRVSPTSDTDTPLTNSADSGTPPTSSSTLRLRSPTKSTAAADNLDTAVEAETTTEGKV